MKERIKEYFVSESFYNHIVVIVVVVLGLVFVISASIIVSKSINEVSDKDFNQLELYHRGDYLELTWDDEGVVSVVPGEDMRELRIVIDDEPLWNWRPDNGTE